MHSNILCESPQANNAFNAGAVAVVMMRPEDQASFGPPTSRIYSELAAGT